MTGDTVKHHISSNAAGTHIKLDLFQLVCCPSAFWEASLLVLIVLSCSRCHYFMVQDNISQDEQIKDELCPL